MVFWNHFLIFRSLSQVTMSTIGYGDIKPDSMESKLVVIFIIAIGLVSGFKLLVYNRLLLLQFVLPPNIQSWSMSKLQQSSMIIIDG